MKKNRNNFYLLNCAPWLVLFCSLCIGGYLWHEEKTDILQQAEIRFLHETGQIELAVIERLQKYELMLRGGVGLFNASGLVDRSEWHAYVSAIDPNHNYPGVQAIEFAQRVFAADKEAHIRRMRAEGFADYSIWPRGEREEYCPVIYLEPFSNRNLSAFGYDMNTETVRRAAMEEARDRGITVISQKVTLVQETDKDVQAGFLMYLPLFKKNRRLLTVQDRRAALQGFILSPFRVNDFMCGILGRGPHAISWEVYDDRDANNGSLLYRSEHECPEEVNKVHSLFEKESRLQLFGKTWLVHFKTLPKFEQSIDRSLLRIQIVASLLISVLLFAITFLLVLRQKVFLRDREQQARFSRELQHSEQCVRRKLNAIVEPDGDIALLELEEILDIQALQQLMDTFYELTGKGVAIIDLKGKVLVGTGWQDICTKFHRINPATLRNCIESDTKLTQEVEPGTFKVYKCKNNMWDCVTPLMIGGRHLGNLFTGQFFFDDDPPDEDIFRAQAAKYGFDEVEYLAALKQTRIWDRRTLSTTFEFYRHLATMISSLSFSKIKLARMLEESRQSEESLRQSEEKYRTLFESMPQGAFYQGSDGTLIDVNPAALCMFGLSRDEFLGKDSYYPLWQVVREDNTKLAPEDHPSMIALRSGKPVLDNVVGLLNLQTRQNVWLIVNAFPQCMPGQDKPFQVFVTLHDITRRKEAENALQAHVMRQKALLGSIPDILMEVNNSRIYVHANQAGRDFFGDDVIGREASFYFIGEQDTYQQVNVLFDGTQNIVRVESWQRRCDGQKRLLSWWCHSLKDGDGNISGVLASARDITESKNIEENLRASMQRFRSYFNLPLHGIAITSVEHGWLEVNDRLCDILGYSRAEIIARTWTEMTYPDDLAADLAQFDRVLSGRIEQYTMEKRFIRRDGTLIWTSLGVGCVRKHDGSVDYIVALIEDITEKKQSFEALKKSEYLQKAILNNIPDIAWLKDSEGTYTAVNDAFATLVGLEAAEIPGKKDQDVWESEYATKFRAADAQVMKTGRRITIKESLPASDGTPLLFKAVKTPLFDAAGSLFGTCGIAHDITDQQKIMEALREASQQWKATFDAMLDPVALLTIDGTIMKCNRAFIDFVSLDYSAVIGRKCYRIIHHSDDFIPGCPTVATLASGVQESMELEVGDRIFLVVADPIKADDGTVAGIVHIMHDITERKHVEEKLTAKNNELERFTYTISHDLKSPLITIRTFIGALAVDMAAGNQTNIEKDIDFIDTAAEKMTTMLEELLQLSRIGRIVNPSVEISLQDLVKDALVLVAGRIAEQSVQVQVTDTPVIVCGDRMRLVQVMQNLIDNAVKFKGQQVAPVVEIGFELRNGDVAVFVRDNGMGIEPCHEDKIFGLFEKLEMNSEGTGLGLALVRRIIEVHGGRIWVESEGSGKGACFWFTLPRESGE